MGVCALTSSTTLVLATIGLDELIRAQEAGQVDVVLRRRKSTDRDLNGLSRLLLHQISAHLVRSKAEIISWNYKKTPAQTEV